MPKDTRTEQEILDDVKKIDNKLSIRDFFARLIPLMREWEKNGHPLNNIFTLAESCKDILPQEFTLLHVILLLEGDVKHAQILKDRGLNPNIKCNGGRTVLMEVMRYAKVDDQAAIDDIILNIRKCLALGVNKNAVNDQGQTALDYLLITAYCQNRLELEGRKQYPELKEVLTGFFTAEEIITGKKAGPTDLKERIEQLEQELEQVKAENLQLKQENAQLRQERSGPASTRLSEIEMSRKEPGARRS